MMPQDSLAAASAWPSQSVAHACQNPLILTSVAVFASGATSLRCLSCYAGDRVVG